MPSLSSLRRRALAAFGIYTSTGDVASEEDRVIVLEPPSKPLTAADRDALERARGAGLLQQPAYRLTRSNGRGGCPGIRGQLGAAHASRALTVHR
jgi:hypothetical protein